jgi:hypothetical protein
MPAVTPPKTWGERMINRRAAIKRLCTPIIAAASVRSSRDEHSLSFFVAGARYFPRQRLALGDAVLLRPVRVAGEAACSVETGYGVQLGFVPKQLLRRIKSAQRARIDALALDGVPWRWYHVSL